MTVTAERAPGVERIRVDAEPYHAELIRSIPGARWNTAEVRGAWSVPLSWAACLQLRTTFGTMLSVGPELRTWAAQHKSGKLARVMGLKNMVEMDGPAELRAFQRPGVEWLQTVETGMLGDETGTGKTVQVAAALKRLGADALPALIVCPLSTLYNWQRELEKWAGLTVAVATGSAAERRKAILGDADVVVMTHGSVRLHSRLAPYGDMELKPSEKVPGDLQARPWRTVVVDEAQAMADPHSKITRGCWYLLHGARYRYLLTATPPIEPWCLLHGLDPVSFPVRSSHRARYYEMAWGEWGGLQVVSLKGGPTADEYHAIVQPYIRAIPKAVAQPNLPPVQGGIGQPMIRYVDLTSKQATAYKAIHKDAMAYLETEAGDEQLYLATSMASKVTRLRQLLSSYLEVDPADPARALLAEPSSKLDAVEEMLRGELSSEPVVIFAQSRQLLMLLSKRLGTGKRKLDHGMIIGGQQAWERQEVIDRFQAGNLPAVLVTTQAGGAGISLHRSRVAVFLQRTGSITWETQAQGRILRDGSEVHDSVLIYDLMARTPHGCPEERMLRLVLEQKAEGLEALVRTRALARYVLTGET